MDKKIAIFLSVGNYSSFFNYCVDNLLPSVDLFINFYGTDPSQYECIKQYSKFFSEYKTTKFPALKQTYNISGIQNYSSIFVFDDDCVLDNGDLLDLIPIMDKFKLKIISPSHSSKAKFSHHIMLQHPGDHTFRYTNFIEMNFPIFSAECLNEYMSIYNGELYGWGNDWWYLNMVGARDNKVCGIVDSVCVINPHNNNKKFPQDSIDNFIARDLRNKQWQNFRHSMNLHEWPQKNLEFIYE